MATEAENLAQRLHDSHGGRGCVAIDMIREQAAEIERLKADSELFARHVGLNLERKDTLLRLALAVICWKCFGECRMQSVTDLPTASEIEAEIKTELGEI